MDKALLRFSKKPILHCQDDLELYAHHDRQALYLLMNSNNHYFRLEVSPGNFLIPYRSKLHGRRRIDSIVTITHVLAQNKSTTPFRGAIIPMTLLSKSSKSPLSVATRSDHSGSISSPRSLSRLVEASARASVLDIRLGASRAAYRVTS